VTHTVEYQTAVSAYLQLQKDHVTASIRATERLIAATIKSQYSAIFQPKYLLLLEGDKARSRALVASTLEIFCRVKRLNLLALGFGIWKILLVECASMARRPQYARLAACHLMSRWQQEVHLKQLRIWIVRWRRRAGALVFIERTNCALAIQTLFRQWRDRCKLVHMHKVQTYLGVLSDIFLAPKRKGLVFFVPDIIRKERRMLWLAATIIQTVFRCWIASRAYFHKRRMVVLIQSVIRMFPRRQKYKRLKATTIKCQAWSRRTVKRIQYLRLKRATIVVQKYVRRYLGFLLKQRIFNRMWRINEEVLAAVIMIQCRWRIHVARKKIKAKRFAIAMRKYSALVIQRNYYRYKKAFHTFFLMCCLREREVEDLKVIRARVSKSRHRAARVLQRMYKKRYFKRNISAIVKVQCWFRGRMGYGLVDILRKERWASRKMRAWAKVNQSMKMDEMWDILSFCSFLCIGVVYLIVHFFVLYFILFFLFYFVVLFAMQVRIRRRHKMALRIQRWWWGTSPGR
jgi:hypothetical protein